MQEKIDEREKQLNEGRDLRDIILEPVSCKQYRAVIRSEESGVLSGIQYLEQACASLGVRLVMSKKNGDKIAGSEIIAVVEGTAKQMALAEEQLIGWVSKASGIATAAAKAKSAIGKRIKIVSGAWKKMPPPLKDLVRQAVVDGGLQYRIAQPPFIYLDKNYVKMLGGLRSVLNYFGQWKDFTTVVQLKSVGQTLLKDAILASKQGASIIMVDTGKREQIQEIDLALKNNGLRHGVKIAFAGNIRIEDMAYFRTSPVDILEIGRAVVDAPLLDLRMDVAKEVQK